MIKRFIVLLLMIIWLPAAFMIMLFAAIHIVFIVPIVWVITGKGLFDDDGLSSRIMSRLDYLLRLPITKYNESI